MKKKVITINPVPTKKLGLGQWVNLEAQSEHIYTRHEVKFD